MRIHRDEFSLLRDVIDRQFVLIPNPGMVMEPCDPPSSLFAARSAITSNGRPGICTVPSHRPAAFSSAREMNADARSKINATRMRSPLHALCPRCEEVVNHWLQGYYAVTASENNESTSRRRDTLIPFLGKIRSTEVQSDRSPFWRDAKSPSRTGVTRETCALPIQKFNWIVSAVARAKRLRQFRRQ